MPYISANEPPEFTASGQLEMDGKLIAKEEASPFPSKNPTYHQKSPTHLQKSPTHTQLLRKRALHICKRVLHIRKRALYIRKEPYISAKEPYIHSLLRTESGWNVDTCRKRRSMSHM